MTEERIYFAHTVNTFNTALETEQLELIRDFFKVEIENPNQPHHQENYKIWKEKYENNPTKIGGMTYYYDVVLPDCTGCVCQIYLDGKWGAGVAKEAAFFITKDQPVWLIEPGTSKIRLLTPTEGSLIVRDDPALVLSREETRARTREGGKPDGKPIPYDRAHLIEYKP